MVHGATRLNEKKGARARARLSPHTHWTFRSDRRRSEHHVQVPEDGGCGIARGGHPITGGRCEQHKHHLRQHTSSRGIFEMFFLRIFANARARVVLCCFWRCSRRLRLLRAWALGCCFSEESTAESPIALHGRRPCCVLQSSLLLWLFDAPMVFCPFCCGQTPAFRSDPCEVYVSRPWRHCPSVRPSHQEPVACCATYIYTKRACDSMMLPCWVMCDESC